MKKRIKLIFSLRLVFAYSVLCVYGIAAQMENKADEAIITTPGNGWIYHSPSSEIYVNHLLCSLQGMKMLTYSDSYHCMYESKDGLLHAYTHMRTVNIGPAPASLGGGRPAHIQHRMTIY